MRVTFEGHRKCEHRLVNVLNTPMLCVNLMAINFDFFLLINQLGELRSRTISPKPDDKF